MSKVRVIEKRVDGGWRLSAGSGSTTVDISFIPDYIKVKFLDPDTNRNKDSLIYDLIYTGDPKIPYQLIISWNVVGGKSRRFKYIVAKLSSFHNGVI